MNEALAWLSLSMVQGIGVGSFWRLVKHFGSPQAVLAAPAAQISQIPGLRAIQRTGLQQSSQVITAAGNELRRLADLGGEALLHSDSRYPDSLRHIADPPPLLFVLGDTSLLSNFSFAIVGSRSATAYGRRIAFSFANKLSAHEITIVSGMALGIDCEAHKGALGGAGRTIGVLGCGLDVLYPRQNQKLFSEVRQHGLLVSEYPLGSQPDAFRFPARNRIIAGLCRGILVVEAARKSGSLITAQYGLEFGREIFAVPGQIDSYKSAGTHWLLQQGALLAASVDDILGEFGYLPASDGNGVQKDHGKKALSSLSPDAIALLRCIEMYPQTRDELFEKSHLDASRMNELLFLLELEQLIEQLPGDTIRRCIDFETF